MKTAVKVMSNKVDKSILLTKEKPFFSLIWLHGLGDSSAGFLDFFQLDESPVYQGGRVKLLHAPFRPVTINQGLPYTSWYDIRSLSGEGEEKDRYNINEVNESLATIDKYVAEEINFWKENGIKGTEEQICKRIFIGGFSQGCAMSLCYALNANRVLAGVIGYSGHLFESFPLKNKEKIPLLVFHGDQDEVLNFEWVRPQYVKHLQPLKNFNFKLIKSLGHSVCQQQLEDSTKWILEQLKKSEIKP